MKGLTDADAGDIAADLLAAGIPPEKIPKIVALTIARSKDLAEHPQFHPQNVFPHILGPSWREEKVNVGPDGRVWYAESPNHPRLTVLGSVARENDGKFWMHVSMSHPDRLPHWVVVKAVKQLFIGPDRKAINVIPADAEFVNIHPYCHHLFACLEGDPLPDFTAGTGSL